MGDGSFSKSKSCSKEVVSIAEMAGIEYVYNAEEERTNADLDYEANKESNADQKEYNLDQQILSMRNNNKLLGNFGADLMERTGFGSRFGG